MSQKYLTAYLYGTFLDKRKRPFERNNVVLVIFAFSGSLNNTDVDPLQDTSILLLENQVCED